MFSKKRLPSRIFISFFPPTHALSSSLPSSHQLPWSPPGSLALTSPGTFIFPARPRLPFLSWANQNTAILPFSSFPGGLLTFVFLFFFHCRLERPLSVSRPFWNVNLYFNVDACVGLSACLLPCPCRPFYLFVGLCLFLRVAYLEGPLHRPGSVIGVGEFCSPWLP